MDKRQTYVVCRVSFSPYRTGGTRFVASVSAGRVLLSQRGVSGLGELGDALVASVVAMPCILVVTEHDPPGSGGRRSRAWRRDALRRVRFGRAGIAFAMGSLGVSEDGIRFVASAMPNSAKQVAQSGMGHLSLSVATEQNEAAGVPLPRTSC